MHNHRDLPILLASASPRRRDLLEAMGLRFGVSAADIPEQPFPGESPQEMALRLSLAKAAAVAAGVPDALVLAADTIVVLEGRVLGKPADAREASAMLRALRGRRHTVYTAVALLGSASGVRCQELAATPVYMAAYDDDQIAAYVATGDPLDKAGAYAIQSEVFDPVARFADCYANVMGLPMCHVYRALRAHGVTVPVHPLDGCPLAVAQGCPWSHGITHARACAATP